MASMTAAVTSHQPNSVSSSDPSNLSPMAMLPNEHRAGAAITSATLRACQRPIFLGRRRAPVLTGPSVFLAAADPER